MLDTQLIENALALCGKTIEDMNELKQGYVIRDFFSIEKFGWYLLSPEFIEEYFIYFPPSINKGRWIVKEFGIAINEYQSGNEAPLIELLSKIGKSNT